MKKSSNEFIAIGLMLFALFFGAGNLIFPAFMGQNSGWNTWYATLGFLITGVGIPFASVLAICLSGKNLEELAGRVHPVYGVLFSCALYLTIGPFFATPRTATVSYEIAITPFLPADMKGMGLYIFAFLFFLLSWYLSISPSKLVPRIGKCITPLLLVFLFLLIAASFFHPMGHWMAPTAAYDTPVKAFSSALLEGYNTMDCLAGLVFGVIVVESIKLYGLTSGREIAGAALKSGLISTFFMALVYAALCTLGASSVSVLGHLENGAPVLVGASAFYFGQLGSVILGIIVILACLTTSIGLTASCAAYFNLLFPRLSHKAWATFFTILSFGVALFGLSSIIKGAIPVLLFLYPLSISLILLTFLNDFFHGSRKVYVLATVFTFVPALNDGLKAAGLAIPPLARFMETLPLASSNMTWILFFAAGLVLGIIWDRLDNLGRGTAEE